MAQQQNKPRRTKALIDREIEHLYRLMAEGMTDREMQKALNMSHRIFYWYKNKMYEHYGNIQRNK